MLQVSYDFLSKLLWFSWIVVAQELFTTVPSRRQPYLLLGELRAIKLLLFIPSGDFWMWRASARDSLVDAISEALS